MSMSPLALLSAASLAAWLVLLLAYRGFWRCDQRLVVDAVPALWPDVAAVIPARDEAATIGEAVRSVLAQNYPGRLRLIVVDDSSRDGTGRIARDAGAELLRAPPLGQGWTGKLWALEQGVTAARPSAPEFYWFTDADIVHPPDLLTRLVAKAETESRDLVSLMVRLRTERPWEKLLVPAFVFFFQMLYPFAAVNDPDSRTAGAAGGCILVRRRRLEAAGGLTAMRDALIDDCTLAAKVQAAGGGLWLGLADKSRSLRGAEGLAPLWRMVKRTAFTQLRYSPLLLSGTLAGLGLAFLLPPAAVALGLALSDLPATLLGGGAWFAMSLAYGPTLHYYRRRRVESVALPVVAALYVAMTLHSAIDHWRGKGSHWKGRDYAADA